MSSQQISEVGSAASGGPRDPRIGTQHSTANPAFSERNFLWLASTRRLYLLLPHEPSSRLPTCSPSLPATSLRPSTRPPFPADRTRGRYLM